MLTVPQSMALDLNPHISIDVKHNIVRDNEGVDYSVHDSKVFTQILAHEKGSLDVWAGSAYRFTETLSAFFDAYFQGHSHRHKKQTSSLVSAVQVLDVLQTAHLRLDILSITVPPAAPPGACPARQLTSMFR